MSREKLAEVKAFTKPLSARGKAKINFGFSNCSASCSGTSGGGTCCSCDYAPTPQEPSVKK